MRDHRLYQYSLTHYILNIHLKSILTWFILVTSWNCYSAYQDRHAEGWHFYEDRAIVEQSRKLHPPTSPAPAISPQPQASPTVILNKLKAELTQRLHKAIVYPTSTNIQAYQQLQKVMLDRAELFGTEWIKVVLQNPSLDYTIQHPITQVGRHLYHDEQRKTIAQRIKALAATHGLFFFFRGDCAYCHQFAPIVKSFADQHHLTIMAISVDGSKLHEFPNAVHDNGAAERLQVTVYPTLLAVEPRSGSVVPLSYGLSTHDQIEERIRLLFRENQP